MSQFQLFDAVKLKEALPLENDTMAPAGAAGAVVEVFEEGEAYLVEIFGGWVIAAANGDFIESQPDNPDSFMETIGIETVSPDQIYLVMPARETVGVRAELLALMDELSENTLEEVKHFAEFLKQKQLNPKKAS